jgi:pilus assembly protein CpaF
MSASLIDRVRERLAAESGPLRPNVVAAAIRAESGGVLGDSEMLSSLRVLQTELTGAGILEPLLCADGTTDVLVTAPDAVWIDDGNGLRRSSIQFADEAAVRRLAQRLALAAGRRLDEAQPWVDGQLTGLGTGQFDVRLHAVLPPIASGGTCLSLRVLRPATQDVARCANVEGVGEVRVRDLVRQALRMRPDRIVVGEVRGAEVVDLLAALNTGHDGGAGTVHANNPAEVPARLEALAALGGLDRAALHSQLAAAVQVVLHVSRDRIGARRLSEVGVLEHADDSRVRVVTAWHADTGFGCGRDSLTRLLRGRGRR